MKPVKSALLLTTILIGTLLWIPLTIAAPNEMNFQGRLTDASGNPLPDGTYPMEFLFYDEAIEGTLIWGEFQNVLVTDGLYNVTIGQGAQYTPEPFDEVVFGQDDRWLQVSVNYEVLTPRQKLTSVAYAFQAAIVANDSITTDMLQAQSITVEKIADDTLTGDKIEDGSITSQDISGGSGSGLDSDTLDGLDGSYYASAAQLNTLQETVTALQNIVTTLQNENQELKNKLQHFSVSGNQIYITEANLHVRSGSGATTGTVNGLGNVIIGYNENRSYYSCSLSSTYNDQVSCEDAGGQWWMNNKTGSHNLVVGTRHNYNRYGGIVAGEGNTISGNFSTVSGGRINTASGSSSSVSGGTVSTASHFAASVSGGDNNTADGWCASVSGGMDNTSSGWYASVSGGVSNTASGQTSSISGGANNQASGWGASISGGQYNKASGDFSSVAGGGTALGPGNEAFAHYSSILGGWDNFAGDIGGVDHSVGLRSTISGGESNHASANDSTINGGRDNVTSGAWATVGGGDQNIARGELTSVSGGYGNNAFANRSSILGGYVNITGDLDSSDPTIGMDSTVSGGALGMASGLRASISGGYNNDATGISSSVSGGSYNNASGDYSSVLGGGSDNPDHGNVAYANYSSILGGVFNITGDPENDPDHTVGERSTISGGDTNRAIGTSSTVSGGVDNHAEGGRSTVSGGASLAETAYQGYRDPGYPSP